MHSSRNRAGCGMHRLWPCRRWEAALAISCGHKENAHKIEQLVYEPLATIGGAVSAEHGTGLYKKPYLQFSRNPVELAAICGVKAALDPKNLMNQRKIM